MHKSPISSRPMSALGVPLLMCLMSVALFFSAAKHEHLSPWRADTWARWDSGQYMSIASEGYKMWREPRMAQGRLVEWNGNTAWFPLYPLLTRAIMQMGVPRETAGRMLAEVFWFLTLVVLWNAFLHRQATGLLPLALAAVFPGAIYFHAIFPTSMTLFFMLTYLHCLMKKRFWLAGGLGLAVGISYTSALYLTGAVLAWGCLERPDRQVRQTRFLLAALTPACGAVLVFCLQRFETGSWDSFFRVWEFHRYNGWSIVRIKQMLYIPTVLQPTALTKTLVMAQSLSVLAVIGCFAAFRREISGHRLLLITILIFWIAPHLSPYRLSWYRAEALLLPMVILMRSLPRAWQWAFLLFWTPLAWLMALQFFHGILV